MVKVLLILLLLVNTASANPFDNAKKALYEKKQVVEDRINKVTETRKDIEELKTAVSDTKEIIAETQKTTASFKEKFLKAWGHFLQLAVDMFQLLSTTWLLCRFFHTLEQRDWTRNMWAATIFIAIYYIAQFLQKIQTGA